MIAPSKSVVRAWRRRVRAAVAGNAGWKRQRTRAPSRWRHNLPWSKLRGVVTIGAFFAAWLGMSPERLLGFAVFWTVCVTLVRANQIASTLHAPEVLWLPFHWPVANRLWVSEQRRAVIRASVWVAADWGAIALGYAMGTGQLVWAATAPLLGVAQWAAALAVAAWTAKEMPRAPFLFGATASWVGIIVCAQLYEKPWAHEHLVGPFFAAFNWATPAGWLRQLGEAAVAGHAAAWAGMIAAAAGGIWVARKSAAVLEGSFSFETAFGYGTEAETELPLHDNSETEAEEAGALELPPLSEAGRAALRAQLASELAKRAAEEFAARSWLERLVWRGLSGRQRVLVEFLRVSAPWSWGRGWFVGLGILVLARIWQFAGGSVEVAGLSAIAAWVFFVLPVFGGTWRGFEGATVLQARIGLQSMAPAGFGEIAWTMLWVNALRTMLALPLIVLSVRYLFTVEPVAWARALNVALQVAVFVLTIQPIWVIAAFSKTTNDTTARWWFTLLLGVAAALLLVSLVVGGVVIAAAFHQWELWIGVGVLLGTAHTLLFLYGCAYRARIFDLVNTGAPPHS